MTKEREEDERKDRERLKAEHAAITPEKLSELMTEKSKLKVDYEAETRRRAEEFTRKLHELEIQIARGQANAPVLAV
jgi:hypothetical protein